MSQKNGLVGLIVGIAAGVVAATAGGFAALKVVHEIKKNIPEFDVLNGGASLYRDRFHMGNCYGRYIVACVWLKKVCGIQDISSARFIPNEAYPPLIKKLNEYINAIQF